MNAFEYDVLFNSQGLVLNFNYTFPADIKFEIHIKKVCSEKWNVVL